MRNYTVTILGTRGSVPVSGSQFMRYGCATTCVLVEIGSQPLVIDAGTGIMALPERVLRHDQLTLLLSHTHADHVVGLPICKYVLTRGKRLDVFAVDRNGLSAQQQIERLMSPPLWPVGPGFMPADIRFHNVPPYTLEVGDNIITAIEGVHPGGVTVFRIEANRKSVVFMTDCTITKKVSPKLEAFAHGCDLLLCDGQYSEQEQQMRSAYGHNSWNMAVDFADRCHAKRLLVIHHDPSRTDEELDAAAEAVKTRNPKYDFAKEGMVVEL